MLNHPGLQQHYPQRPGTGGRRALAAATPCSSLLTVLLGGPILLNRDKQEVPSDSRSSFGLS